MNTYFLGVMGSKTTCLHAIIAFLDAGGYAGTYPKNILTSPSSSELAYKLIFMLCTNRDTSGPTLRYLRSTHDFLFRHLQFLPFKMTGNYIYLRFGRRRILLYFLIQFDDYFLFNS